MKKKILIFTLLMAFAFSTTAFAKDITFTITKSQGAVQVATNSKDLSGSTWYISNFDSADSDFIEGEDVIGFKAFTASGTAVSTYHTFGNFVNRYPLSYTSTPSTGASLYLNAQVDSTGAYSSITFDGEWVS